MSLPTSRIAYPDCFDIFERAYADPQGIRVGQPSIDAATHLRMRMHNARRIDRADNAVLYAEDHPMHGRSPYDKLIMRIRDMGGAVYLYVEHIQTPTDIESLSEIVDDTNSGNGDELMAQSSEPRDRDTSPVGQDSGAGESVVRIPQGLRRL